MFSDLLARPLNPKAYNNLRFFTLLDHAAQNDPANITAINLIENGDRAARENWQNQHLTNLLRYAQAHSKFWRQRMPSRMINHNVVKYLPIQSRQDIVTQAEREGTLVVTNSNTADSSYASTGSTGTPVKVYICPENGYYNTIRSLAQYFISNLSLDEDRVQIIPATSLAKLEKRSLAVEFAGSWAGPLSKIFRNGSAKK